MVGCEIRARVDPRDTRELSHLGAAVAAMVEVERAVALVVEVADQIVVLPGGAVGATDDDERLFLVATLGPSLIVHVERAGETGGWQGLHGRNLGHRGLIVLHSEDAAVFRHRRPRVSEQDSVVPATDQRRDDDTNCQDKRGWGHAPHASTVRTFCVTGRVYKSKL